MEAILKELSGISDSDLRKEMTAAGLSVSVISKSTRKFFEKRLAAKLLQDRGGSADGDGDGESKVPNGKQTDTKDAPGSGSDVTGSPSTAAADQTVQAKPQETAAKSGTQSSSRTSSSSSETYYVVCIPADNGPATSKISQNQKEVLKMMKENTEARFKTFKSSEDADKFARLQTNLTTPKKAPDPSSNEQQNVSERANTYRTPKPQQLNALRFAIEKKEGEKFSALVWGNPRYLVTAVDTPTFLHEGCKYNALHVAAMKNLPGMMKLILDTLGNPELPRLLYPNDSEESVTDRWEFVTHLYLNSPEKGNGENPLHFASKFGFVECIQLLLDHPKCNKRMANKYGQTASQIICNRYKGHDKDSVQTKIAEMLNDHFYIPMWRAEDDSKQAVIGEPWSPDIPNSQSALLSQQVRGSPIESSVSVRALAGPMSPSDADAFHKTWKTPPSSSKKMAAAIRRGDSEKGLERIGRDLAHNRRVPWMEYWSFLDEFVDLSSTEGLELLEEYLAERYRYVADSPLDELRKTSSQPVPTAASIMKNLVTEFTKVTPPKQDGVTRGSESNASVAVDNGFVDSLSSRASENKVGPEAEDATEDLSSKLQGVSLNASNTKAKGDADCCERTSGQGSGHKSGGSQHGSTNAAGDPGECVPGEDGVSHPSYHLKLLGRTGSGTSTEAEGSLVLTGFPLVSPPSKAIKNSTQVTDPRSKTSSQGSTRSSPGPKKEPGTPKRKSPLFSPIQMVTNMMSRLTLGSGKQQDLIVEESNVDTGESVASGPSIKNHSETSVGDPSLLSGPCVKDSTEISEAVPSVAGEEGNHGRSVHLSPTNKDTCVVSPRGDHVHVQGSSSKSNEINHSAGETLANSSHSSRTLQVEAEPCLRESGTNRQPIESTRISNEIAPSSSEYRTIVPANADADTSKDTTSSTSKGNIRLSTDTTVNQDAVLASHDDKSVDNVTANTKDNSCKVTSGKLNERGSTEGATKASDDVDENSREMASPKTPDDTKEDAEGFHTPVNQRIMASPTNGSPGSASVFISGDTPTKLDLHVLRALAKTDIGDMFPFVRRWKQAIEGVPEEMRQRWRTPVHSRRQDVSPSPRGNHTSSPSPHRHPSPLVGGRSPILQRIRNWSEPAGRVNSPGRGGAQGGGERGTFITGRDGSRGQSPTGGRLGGGGNAGSGRDPRQNLMSSAYMQ